MFPKGLNIYRSHTLLFWLLVVVAIGISVQQYQLGGKHLLNLMIYKMSFFNLIHHRDIYSGGQVYDGQKIDLFKYSPAFALFYAPLAILPLWGSIVLWNLLNVILFFFAIRSLPIAGNQKALILWLALPELITSLQYNQSNLIMAALIILAFSAMEKQKILLAAFCIVLSVFIKLFGAVAFLLFLFYPRKSRVVVYTLLWSALFFFIPLLVVSAGELPDIYKSWGGMLSHDHSVSGGFSVMAITSSWLGINAPRAIMQVAGIVLLIIPLISYKVYPVFKFRILYLCSILLWVVTFNHRAESPSFIIAMAGIALWFVQVKTTALNIALLIFAEIATSFLHSDLVTPFTYLFSAGFVDNYVIKGLPAFVLWCVIQFNLYEMAFKRQRLPAHGSIGELQK